MGRQSKSEQFDTVRFAGREYPVLDRLTIGRRPYLILKRLSSGPRQRFMAFDPYAGPGGDLRAILVLPRSAASRQHLRVLKAASANVNLPTILDYRPHADDWLLVMQWVRGPDLKTYLSAVRKGRQVRPSAVEAFRLVRGLAHGLSQLHRRTAIVHGDVKPANLILAPQTIRLVLIDFGSAWQPERTATRAEGDGMHASYAAPELQNSSRFVDFRSDQFSASVILYELLTLFLPYDGLGGKAGRPELASVMAPKYVPPSRLSPDRAKLPSRIWQGIDRVVTAGLAINPDNRYSTPNAWLDDIEQVFRALQPQCSLSPLAERATRVVNWLGDRFGRR